MREQRTEHDSHGLATVDDAKAIKGTDEEYLYGLLEIVSKRGEDTEHKGRNDLKGNLDGRVGEEKRFGRVATIGFLAIEDIPLIGVDGDVLKHT